MQLDAITTALRPRNAWEASDLGLALTRRWLQPVYAAWFTVALPLFLLLHLACWGHWWLVPWLLWWLKPLLDRLPLYVLSRALFGAAPSRRQFWRDLPGLLRRHAFTALTLHRLDTARSFTLPVGQLEELSGKARRQRVRTLGQPGRGPAVWLTVVCLHLEIALDFALIMLVWMLLPDFVVLEFNDLLDGNTALGQFWLNMVGFCGLSLVEPFYVAAGFALYLNRRTWLEAWDLEIGFRRLAARLAQTGRAAAATLALLVIGLGLFQFPLTGFAAGSDATPSSPSLPPAKTTQAPQSFDAILCAARREQEAQLAQAASAVKQALAETLREPELQICAVQERWRFRDDQPEAPSQPPVQYVGLGQWFATVLEYSLWVGLGIFIVIAGRWLLRAAPHWSARTKKPRPAPASATILQGQGAAVVSPNAGLAATAWQLWACGQPREALRLLYQGSLAALATHYALPVQTSATEDECLRLAVARLADPELLSFFRQLTRAWQATAYAHRPPDAATAQALCAAWPRYFAAAGELPA